MTMRINGSTGLTFPSGATQADSAGFPSGTVMLFVQTTAPVGWTKSTTHDNKAIRVVSGTVSSGGTVAFTTAFASKTPAGSVSSTTATNTSYTPAGSVSVSGSVGSTTLSSSEIPSHNHLGGFPRANGYAYTNSLYGNYVGGSYGIPTYGATGYTGNFAYTSSTGGGGSHNHSFSGSGSFSGSAATIAQNSHTHTFTGTAIDLAVQYVDVIIATKD